ncbi:MAG: hypothetical protein M3Q71_13185 [Chloroflexota bacterium]|nr:hypothetical protein [Chloroflexota bacterium]
MSTTATRRDLVKAGAGFVIGATLTSGTAPAEVAAAVPRRDMGAVFAWERALQAADDEGAAWVGQARILKAFLITAAAQAEDVGLPAVAASLRPQIAEADKIYQERAELFADWGFQAWALPDLGLLPPMPWR